LGGGAALFCLPFFITPSHSFIRLFASTTSSLYGRRARAVPLVSSIRPSIGKSESRDLYVATVETGG
jgi:hypothetical protein